MDPNASNNHPSLYTLHIQDARNVKKHIRKYTNKNTVFDVIITSPPYHDILSYDNIDNQIGYGQKYEDYIKDIGNMFEDIYHLTSDSGSLWMVINTFTKDKKLIMLPYDIANEIQKYGWILKDIIIWKKDKTNPWYKKGQMRKIFEYILFFTKSNNFTFYQDKIREINPDNFKEWWIKYPERYNIKGKLPTNIWDFSIPVQGEWGVMDLKHRNPLPIDMIKRIILLTTDEQDVVFDPFSGSGIVLAVASYLNRNYIGFDLNPKYVNNFHNVQNSVNKYFNTYKELDIETFQNQLSEKLINLRLLKYSKTLYKKLIEFSIFNTDDLKKINSIFFLRSFNNINNIEKIGKIVGHGNMYIVFNKDKKNISNENIKKITIKKSLTRFQTHTNLHIVSKKEIYNILKNKNHHEFYLYSKSNTHKYAKIITLKEWLKTSKEEIWLDHYYNFIPPILSNIEINEIIHRTWKPKNDILNNERIKLINLINKDSST